jgi:NTP pyrophosphatase (non-canonical NTP hydrolase)
MSEIDLNSLTKRLVQFRDERNWEQFHSLKDLIISLNLEASELLELTQWKDSADFEASVMNGKARADFEEECADVLLYLLLITEKSGIDLLKAASDKIDKNARKYPVDKAKGNAKKYTEL